MRLTDTRGRDQWRIAVVEDHRLQRQRTVEVLRAQRGLRVVAATETLVELLAWLATAPRSARPDLLVLDLHVDRGPNNDPEAVRRLMASGVRVLVLSALTAPRLAREFVDLGVSAIVSKRESEADIVMATWKALRDESWVSPEVAAHILGSPSKPAFSIQEERTLVLYASGLKLDEVASLIGVSPNTARKYLSRVKAKYAERGRVARTKIELHREAVGDGLIDAEH